jgi:iron complex outermembrane recepter protein
MRSLLRLSLLLLYLLTGVAASSALAQTGPAALQGRITTDAGQPAALVNVALLGTTRGTAADEQGEFRLDNLPAGAQTVVVSAVGFETRRQSVQLTAGETTRLDVVLAPQSQQLQQVEVTGRRETSYKSDYSFAGTRTQTAVKDIPQIVSTVTKELIADQQAYRLNDVVRNVAGANQFSTYDDITIRGFRSSDNRYLNGLRYTGNFWTSPLLVNIERVEVVKGPAAALFGNAAPGGVINMVTKKPLAERRAGVNFAVGSFNTLRTTADFTGPMNDDASLLYRLNLGYEDAETFRDAIFNKTLAVAPSFSFLPSEKTRLNVDLSYSRVNTRLDRGRPTFEDDQSLLSTPVSFNLAQPTDKLQQSNLSAIVSWNQQITKNLSFNASYLKYVFDEHLVEHGFNGYLSRDSVALYYTDRLSGTRNDNLSAYAVGTFRTGEVDHTTLGGVDFARYDYYYTAVSAEDSTVGGLSLVRPRYFPRDPSKYTTYTEDLSLYPDEYTTLGLYVQHQLRYKRLQALLSLRRETYRVPGSSYLTGGQGTDEQTAWLPRLGLVYALTPAVNLFANYNQGFQPVDPATNLNPRTGGPFKPQYSRLVEVGSKAELLSKRVLASVAVYDLTQNNVLVTANDPTNPDRLVQRGQERARGVELEAAGNILPNLTATVSYAYNNARVVEGNAPEEAGKRKENAPYHVSGSWLKYTFGPETGALAGLGLALGHSQVSSRTVFDAGLILPNYTLLNAAAYYTVGKVRLALNVNNLTNKTHWVGGYSYNRNFPGAPRNFLVSVGYSF